jgi:predicted nucleic acid-binding protein
MKVYLDVCCLNRPFDDQLQPRIHFETEAILLILAKLNHSEWDWVGSETLFYEIRRNPDEERRQLVLSLAAQAHFVVEVNEKILERAEALELKGFDSYDSIHLASAEEAQADIFLTTDDRMIKLANRNKKILSLQVENPVKWLEQVLK